LVVVLSRTLVVGVLSVAAEGENRGVDPRALRARLAADVADGGGAPAALRSCREAITAAPAVRLAWVIWRLTPLRALRVCPVAVTDLTRVVRSS